MNINNIKLKCSDENNSLSIFGFTELNVESVDKVVVDFRDYGCLNDDFFSEDDLIRSGDVELIDF